MSTIITQIPCTLKTTNSYIISCQTAGQNFIARWQREIMRGSGMRYRLASAWVLIHEKPRWALPLHMWLRVLARRTRATMINVVIKPVGRLLSVTLDHLVRELQHGQWSKTKLGAVRSASETNLSSEFDVLPLGKKKTLSSSSVVWHSLLPLKCRPAEVIFAVRHTLKLYCCWFRIRGLIGVFILKR